jgi:hypothetical protein
MKRLWLIPLFVVALLIPTGIVLASNGGNGFDGVVRSIESEYHVHATRIPFMGLASLIVGGATHGGVGGVHVAEFEHFSMHVDGEELNQMVEKELGPDWERAIRETSRKGNEQTLIFIHPEGKRMGMFIVDKNDDELDVVEVSVDPDHLNESIGKYDHQHDKGGTDEDISD